MSATMAASSPLPRISMMAEPGGDPIERPRDYYDPAWGRQFEDGLVDTNDELWARNVPLMRIIGFTVLGAALVLGYPRGAATPAAAAVLALWAALVVAFWLMWVRRRIWDYSPRTLAIHGVFQVLACSALVAISPSFAIVEIVVYPQVVFSLPVRWAISGALFIGAATGLAILARSADLATGLPWLVASVLVAALVAGLGVWIRLTIAQSLERQVLIAQLRAAREDLARAAREAAVAEERARMSREIHDTLAQGFASVVTHLEAADARLAGDPEAARSDVRAAEDAARASLAEARTLVWALRPDALAEAGLPAAIRRVAGAAGGPGVAVEVEICGTPRQLHPDVEVALLRAAQEALANARRHAAAAQITVTLTYFDDEVTLDVADDGRGFDPAVAARGGMGLTGMRERAERLGGSVAIESAPGEGCVVALRLPAIEPVPPALRPPDTRPAASAASESTPGGDA